MVWIFLLVISGMVTGAVSSDRVMIGGSVGSVHKNAPYVIQYYYGIMSLISLLMTTAFMNATATRDFHFRMYPFIFTSPIKERDYFFGKFFGTFIISIIPLIGVSVGSLIGPFMSWVQPDRYGDIILSGHLYGLLAFGVPNTFIAGVILFGLAMLYRNNMVSFAGAMFILVFYAVSSGFTADIEKEWLANIIDPFGFRPLGIFAKYMTIDEKNLHAAPLAGALLFNRLLWVGIGMVILAWIYSRFSFNLRTEKIKRFREAPVERSVEIFSSRVHEPGKKSGIPWNRFFHLIGFETLSIIKNPTFIIIVVLGLLNLMGSLTSFTGRYGVDQYPVTYDVVDSIRGSYHLFIMAVIIFYTGVLVWKERDAGIHEIRNATAVPSGIFFYSKLMAMLIALELIIALAITEGIIAQTLFGYYRYQVDVYVKSLMVVDMLTFAYLTVIALLFHYLINNRYIAYFVFAAFAILNQFIWDPLQISSNMVKFGGMPAVIYSDMNGFGPYVSSVAWFSIYWILGCMVIALITYSFYFRTLDFRFRSRLKTSGKRLWRNRGILISLLLLFIICGGFIYYNTQIINQYDSSSEAEKKQADYEKNYKKYENLVQPRFYRLDFRIDLMPSERDMTASVDGWIRNISAKPVSELHLTMPVLTDSVKITVPGSRLKLRDNRLKYRIYSLEKPLMPGDSLLIGVDVWCLSKGFENEVSFTQLTQNGTFFNNIDIMPSLGYNPGMEISDRNIRKKLNLPPRIRMPRLDTSNLAARANNYLLNDADWVEVSTIISTNPDQIAVAPGSLVEKWNSNGRNFFRYQLDHKSFNFFSFISARYEVAREKWNDIDLEVYYVREHAYNVPNMMRSIRLSLEYYTTHFGPYYHKQCRIIEFPRYAGFAQSFPGTMPYSEGIGFIVDLRNVTKDDIDQVFYVVAHEMAHQYWAHQVCGAGMQGSEMMSESFSQYSALMVMEKEYGRDKMHKFLKYEMDGYLKGRTSETEAERPLMKTENQPYIHYHKGSVVMYYLKEMIGEAKVNEALRSLIDQYAYKSPPYPTSWSAIKAFRKVTPDSLQYLITDLFENITVFNHRVTQAGFRKNGDQFEVTFTTESEKYLADTLGKETSTPISDYIDIGIFAEPEKHKNLGSPLIYQRVIINKKENTFTFRTRHKPYQVGIDPYNYLIDRMPGDNLRKPVEL